MKRAYECLKLMVTGFLDHNCGLHAAGLTYFTLMAFVPILCLLMAFAKTCGVGDFARKQITGYADSFIARVEQGAQAPNADPILAKGQDEKRLVQHAVAVQLRQFVDPLFDQIDRFDIRTFGWVGFGILLWTIISTLGQIEVSLNEIWEVATQRTLMKRCWLYLFVAGVVPLLGLMAVSLPILRLVRYVVDHTVGAVVYTKWVSDAVVALLDSRIFSTSLTLVFATLAFTLVQAFMPNRHVRLVPACVGGIVTAVTLAIWIWLCTAAQVGIGKCSAFYGSFATPVIVLAWIYMSWQLVLFGANFTYAFQHFYTRDSDVLR